MAQSIEDLEALGDDVLLGDFRSQEGVHCETTMLRNLLAHAGVEVSEAMLFGLGEGIDFQYHGAPQTGPGIPFVTGRNGPSDVVRIACAAIGVELVEQQPATVDEAHRQTVDLLRAGHAVGVTVDIYHLDYFASKSHFSAHCIALFGIGSSLAHVVDTTQQGGAQTLPADSLIEARSSDEGYMPSPLRQMYVKGLSADRTQRDLESEIPDLAWHAISACSDRMLSDRGPKLGLRGIELLAEEVPTWSEGIHPVAVADFGRFWRHAGTGGTNFRGLFLDFLRELEDRERDPELALAVDDFESIDQHWHDLIELLIGYPTAEDQHARLRQVQERLRTIAAEEKHAFERLQDAADSPIRGSR